MTRGIRRLISCKIKCGLGMLRRNKPMPYPVGIEKTPKPL
jgi:hypothetical protein